MSWQAAPKYQKSNISFERAALKFQVSRPISDAVHQRLISCGSEMALKLPFDLLVFIQSFADQTTISRMMRTCRYLHELGERFLLSDVRLSSRDLVEGFSKYMLLSCSDRLSMFCALRLEMDSMGRSSSESLRELFVKMRARSKLVSLTILHPEEVLLENSGVSSAIAALSSLRHLELWNVGPMGAELLRSLQSKLVRVSLKMKTDEADWWPNSCPDVSLLVRGSKDTLEELRVSHPGPTSSDPDGDESGAALAFGMCYPCVRTFVVEPGVFTPYTADYLRAYPELESLTVRGPKEYPRREDRAQLDPNIEAPWASLRYVEGSMMALYGLALPCHVSTVHINDFDFEPNMTVLRTVLADTRPVHLKLSIFSARCCKKFYVPALEQLELPSLQALSLNVVLMCDDTHLDITKWMVCSSLYPRRESRSLTCLQKCILRIPKAFTKLSAFELHFDCSRLTSAYHCLHSTSRMCPANDCMRPSLLPIERQLKSLSMRSLARRIQKRVPHVRRIVTRMSGHYAGYRACAELGERLGCADI